MVVTHTIISHLMTNKIASQRKTHAPRFLYLRETKSWWCEGEGDGEGGEGGEEENVSMLTHTTARGMGKKDKKSICRPMVPSLGTVGKKHLSLMLT